MSVERRVFEREDVAISFIYSFDEGSSLADGEWKEAQTIDIGPVLVGGMAFHSDEKIEENTNLRIALFMDLNMKSVWDQEPQAFPVYNGTVCRVFEEEGKYRVAIMFQGFERELVDSDGADAEIAESE